LRNEFLIARRRRRLMLAATMAVVIPFAVTPLPASAEGLFDFFFGNRQRQEVPPQASAFADPTNGPQTQAPVPQGSVARGSGPAFCVRSCDGKYFPLMRGAASPVQMCQAFCPASATKVFYGSNIDSATSVTGERYATSENAFAYRKALRADCTCNGRNSAGLAPVDLALDNSLRAGDVVATTEGLVAYSGMHADGQAGDFTPIASYPGLTAGLRARLGEMKVAPVTAEVAIDAPPATTSAVPLPPVTRRDKRASAN
jgi:hypothetical protein